MLTAFSKRYDDKPSFLFRGVSSQRIDVKADFASSPDSMAANLKKKAEIARK